MKQIINTNKSPSPIGPYNQAIIANNMLFISGQVGVDPISMNLKDKTIKEETDQVMINIKNILEDAKLDFNSVVKTTIFLSDMSLFKIVNEIYGNYFEKGKEPARETVAVKTLPLNVNVEISMIAVFN